jgi:hypothetical protein
MHVRLREAIEVIRLNSNSYESVRKNVQQLPTLLNEQDPLNTHRRVRIHHITRIPEVVHQQWQDAQQLLLRQLIPERVQEPNRVRREDRVCWRCCRLKVPEDMIAEEVDDVD